ncbi:helix-turn-helix domain-containing protein [Nakamurella sp. DB0629]|uniref:Helix-turn-helix domain-containing protein n=1 Tax=Nakamurella aerolata TaxID=1656892 RepID=A0A849A845_9ACTN|nr:helix-turn-helix domain-containing protein [Nakamurella aerolata]NNG36665.1 helix-turn-helix domain-containing protein [Nakamurella aerolata]
MPGARLRGLVVGADGRTAPGRHNAERAAPTVANDRFLTLADVADVLNVSLDQVTALLHNGDLKGIQIGGRRQWRVERSKLEEYIEQAYAKTEAQLASSGRGAGAADTQDANDVPDTRDARSAAGAKSARR